MHGGIGGQNCGFPLIVLDYFTTMQMFFAVFPILSTNGIVAAILG